MERTETKSSILLCLFLSSQLCLVITISAETTIKSNFPNDKEKGSSKQISNATCQKDCQSHFKLLQNRQCTINNYKTISSNNEESQSCFDQCKATQWCFAAIFLKPRNLTASDLQSLYQRVVSSGSLIRLEHKYPDFKPEADFERLLNQRYRGYVPSTFGLTSGYRQFSPQNNEVIIRANHSHDCLLFDDYIGFGKNLFCTYKANNNFEFHQFECTESEKCLRSNRNCRCGWCGPGCRDLNYARVENACMSKYFFGHTIASTEEECINFCLETPKCKSVDFGSRGSCLINYVDRQETQLSMGCDGKNNEMWDYLEIICDSECPYEKPRPPSEEDTCMNFPNVCKNGGVCETVQSDPPLQSFTYRCNCPCNWCGKNCEHLNMKTFPNGCLKDGVLAWAVAESSSDCIEMCLNELQCLGVSYSRSAGTCALHWIDTRNTSLTPSNRCPNYRIDLEERDWTFYEVICDAKTCHSELQKPGGSELKGCALKPCLNDGVCADIFRAGNVIGYHCFCKCGYCGDRCEKPNFKPTEDACIWGSNISDDPSDFFRKSISKEKCLDLCAAKYPLCKSVDYSHQGNGTCYLNDRGSDSEPITPKCNNFLRQQWTLYDVSCKCTNNRVLFETANKF